LQDVQGRWPEGRAKLPKLNRFFVKVIPELTMNQRVLDWTGLVLAEGLYQAETGSSTPNIQAQ
jgi:hypothetical protein